MDPIIVGALITGAAQILAARIASARRRPREAEAGRRGATCSRPVLLGWIVTVAIGSVALVAFLHRDVGIGSFSPRAVLAFWSAAVDWDPSPLRLLVFWFALTAGFGLVTGTFPRGRATTTVAAVPDVAALLMFGPAVACVVVGIGHAVAAAGRPPARWLFHVSQIVTTVAVTGLAYSAAGGDFGREISLGGLSLVALLLAPPVYFLITSSLLTVAIRLRERVTLASAWRRNFEWQVPHVFFLLLPFGILLALCQVWFGVAGGILCSATVVFAHFAFRGWIRNRSARFETVRMIVSEMDRTHPSTANHSTRIAARAVKVAWELGASAPEADDIELAALFHDLGTIAMKHEFLLEPRPLTDDERRVVRRHPEIAYHLLRRVPLLRRAAEIVLCHQEHLDGTGYPRGLRGEEIPLGSRVLLAVDAFDSLVHGRAHRGPRPAEEAYKELRAGAGSQFAPDVVEALIRLHREGRLDDDPDGPFREGQAQHRYGLRMFKYRTARRIRHALSFFRQGIAVLLRGANGKAPLPPRARREDPREGLPPDRARPGRGRRRRASRDPSRRDDPTP